MGTTVLCRSDAAGNKGTVGCCCCWLQDTARNFLCGTVADKKKYEIFMKVC
jgi:hypothetical protein